jgi:hypothetical protein
VATEFSIGAKIEHPIDRMRANDIGSLKSIDEQESKEADFKALRRDEVIPEQSVQFLLFPLQVAH